MIEEILKRRNNITFFRKDKIPEKEQIDALPSSVGLSLGPRILRADTAALAALSVVQAIKGDW